MTQINDFARLQLRPAIVLSSVRAALRETITWRKLGGHTPTKATFKNIAVASLPRTLHTEEMATPERIRVNLAIQEAAGVFYDSTLGHRLMCMPTQNIEISGGLAPSDCLVIDLHRRAHRIALTMSPSVLEASALATRIANEPKSVLDTGVLLLTVHILSLTTGKRMVFSRERRACQRCNGTSLPKRRVA
jgi:hypothetical protein